MTRRRRQSGRPPPAGPRLVHYLGGAASMACFIGALRFVEALIAPPVDDAPRWLVAAVVSSTFWLAGAALGGLAMLVWLSRRVFGWPPPEASAIRPSRAAPPTAEMRLRMLGFNVVAGWVVVGTLALIVMADTGTGPFAWIAHAWFGRGGLAGVVTFLLGVPALAAPLVLLALLPWRSGPLLASMQAAVKPPRKARARRPKP